ncbi:hypothetical protein CABS01_12549 [Colletotrichum abscissum]|uniref:uncharacterized protein n=1 Tax=Colletotrichum abscissum TaxID=1671311 RepID=UPI0027D4D91A|nr:uncharacterized protein CABS01_12549 [Colletotrichum abscissum]KAK1489968.1 hypothetical protein CABS01_12549 [Colletotrichum abscissum]
MAPPADETPTTDAAPAPAPILFRANKKRKAGLRQRAASPAADDDDNAAASKSTSTAENNTTSAPATETTADEGPEAHIPSALRHRARKRLNGVGFSARGTTALAGAGGDDTDPVSLSSSSRALVSVPAQAPDDDPLIAKRFAPQTGAAATTIVNKHMMEYIESHLSNRNPPPQSELPTSSQHQAATVVTNPSTTAPSAGPAELPDPKNHPIMQGKLMEVDLGDEVRARNQAMTEKAARRLLGESVDDDTGGRRAKKPRLGRDGKPWRPRNRRTSDDIKRDQLVEEILRENRREVCTVSFNGASKHMLIWKPYLVDVYDVPKPQEPQNEGDGDADDRIAEEFRREFMDAMVQRQQKKKTAAPAARAGARKADEEVLKGPKLGGSRNARAAMRDLLLKKEKEKDSRR